MDAESEDHYNKKLLECTFPSLPYFHLYGHFISLKALPEELSTGLTLVPIFWYLALSSVTSLASSGSLLSFSQMVAVLKQTWL